MEPDRTPPAGRLLASGVAIIAGLVVLMWAIEAVDSVVLGDRLQSRLGILPRRTFGLDGIAFAPLLHADLAHLISNSLPFAVLGGLVMLRGIRRWLAVTLLVMAIGGGLTWLLAGSGNHIGASGVVFGYLGYLVAAAYFERKWRSALVAIVAVMLYGGAIVGVIPQAGISWEGHLFGTIGGVLAARMLTRT